jgi:guanylate kinase
LIEFDIKRTGMLFIVSAPSGGGKSTILKALLESDPTLSYSVSATTRPPRATEVDGRDYHFLSLARFEELVDQDAFYEYAQVHGNYYGTLKSEVNSLLERGFDVLLDVDVQGSLRLKKDMPECTTIFILPPSMATLEKRLRGRGSDSDEVIERRLRNARGEIRMAEHYDYILLNINLQETIDNMRNIIKAQHFRSSRIIVRDPGGSVLSPASI